MDQQMSELFKKAMSLTEKPSKVMLQIAEYENEHAVHLLNTYNGFIQYFEHAYECIVAVNYALNYIDKSYFPRQRTIQLLVYTNSIGTFYSAFLRFRAGFYTDTMILCRSVYESVIRMMFCSYYPEHADSVWLDDPPKGKVRFNVTNFVKNQLKADWVALYKLLCLHSHSNIFNSLTNYGKLVREGQKRPIAFVLTVETDKIEMCMNVMTFLLWNYLHFFQKFFLSSDGPRLDESMMNNLDTTEKLLDGVLASSPNAFKEWHQNAIGIYSRLFELEKTRTPKRK